MAGTVENGSLASLEGNIAGPNGMYVLTAAVVDNGDSYTVTGGGAFTAGPLEGTVSAEITTDSNFTPDLDSLNISGDINVDTSLAGNHILMSGTMENASLQSLIGTIEGPNGMYFLNASVIDNGGTYTITAGGAFAVGPIEGNVEGSIETDSNFNPDFDSLSLGGDAAVDMEVAGHHIVMTGVMLNGSLVSLAGTIEGPNGLYKLTASVVDNGDGYTIEASGDVKAGPVEGTVEGTINTDSNFKPDFETLNLNGQATINTETAGQKVSGTAIVRNGYLESIAGTLEGPGGLYTLNAKGVREGEEGYDFEAGGAFTFFDESMKISPPPILIPVGIPGLNIEISTEVDFNAKASADILAGIKTDSHFIPDPSTFEIRHATLLGHGEVAIDIFGGVNVSLGFASAAAGIKAQLKGVIDAVLELTADSKGFKVSGSVYAGLIGALYAAVKLKFLFYKKEFDYLIKEGKVASMEKEFGPTDFTLGNILKGFAFGMDDLSIPGKDPKAKPPKLKEDQKSDEVESAKSEGEDAKSEAEDSKSDDEDSKSDKEDSKSDKEDSKSDKEDSKSDKEDSKSDGEDSKSDDEDCCKSDKEDSKSDKEDTKSDKKDSKSDKEDTKSDKKDSKSDDSGGDENTDDPFSGMAVSMKADSYSGKAVSIQEKSNGSGLSGTAPVQRQAAGEGLPSNLQSGVEQLSGQNMSDVSVHKNSDKPAQLNAHAYAQGSDIHIAPGQEKHLPHEAWHVAQQKQGRVTPTKQLKGKVNINDDEGLEKEADVMGAKALDLGNNGSSQDSTANSQAGNSGDTSQLKSNNTATKEMNSLQTKANSSPNVSQLMDFNRLANSGQNSISQLQKMADKTTTLENPYQMKESYSQESVNKTEGYSEQTESTVDISPETNEI